MAVTPFDPPQSTHAACIYFTVLAFIEPDLLPITVLFAGIGNFMLYCFCDIDRDPMTFIYELDLYPLKTYGACRPK